MVWFLFVDFSSPEGYLEILWWRLITSPLLKAFGDLLRPSKQLWRSQHFGNIATALTMKRPEAVAESTPCRGKAWAVPAQEWLQLSSTPLQVCAHAPAPAPCAFLLTELVFPVESCSLQVLRKSLLLAHREGWRRSLHCRVENADVWQFRAVWQKISLPLQFPGGIQLFAIPSCLSFDLVANHSPALGGSSSPPATSSPCLLTCSPANRCKFAAWFAPCWLDLHRPFQLLHPGKRLVKAHLYASLRWFGTFSGVYLH